MLRVEYLEEKLNILSREIDKLREPKNDRDYFILRHLKSLRYAYNKELEKALTRRNKKYSEGDPI